MARSKSPEMFLSVRRAAGAPMTPSTAALSRLFRQAWSLVPERRRPATPARRVAVDLHIVGDGQIAELNLAHMKHAGPTDVLAFPMGETDPERRAYYLGEVVVSFQTARREAAERRISAVEELSRYCVHGFIHLLGYADKTDTQRRILFSIQEEAIGRCAVNKRAK